MYRKFISFILAASIFCLLVVNAWAAQSPSVNLSLGQALDLAVANDRDLKQIDAKTELAERRYSTAVAISKDAPSKYWGSDTQHIANLKEEKLYPMQRQADLDELKWQRQNTEDTLKISVTKLYYQILQKKQAMDNQAKIIDLAKKELDNQQKKFKAGSITESSLLSYEIAINDANIGLQSLQRDMDNLVINFNEKLGQDLGTKVTLVNFNLPADELKLESLDQLVSDVTTASHDVKKLENDKVLKKTEYDILYQNSFYTPDECKTLEDDMLNLDFDVNDKKASIELKIRTDYNNILNLKDDIALKKLDLDQKTKLCEVTKKRYDLGMAINLDYIKAKGDVDTAQVAYNQAQLDYFTAVQDFKLYIYPVTIP